MIYLAAALLLSFFVIEGLLFYYGTRPFAADSEKADYMLILGAGLSGEKPLPLLESRLKKALAYLQTNPQIKVIVSGGKGPGETITEAEAMKRYLVGHRIKEGQIIIEDKSANTFENILFTKNKLAQIDGRKNIKIIILTSDFHMLRAKMLARQQGFTVLCLPAETPAKDKFYYFSREYLAILKTLVIDNFRYYILDNGKSGDISAACLKVSGLKNG